MKLFYSSSADGFYCDLVHGGEIPEDAVEISSDEHSSAIEWQSAGGVIAGVSADGVMILEESPPATGEQLAGIAINERRALLSEAALRIAPLQDAVDLEDATDVERSSLLAWKRYRVELNRIEHQSGYPHTIDWPDKPE